MTAIDKGIEVPDESFGKRLRFAREQQGLSPKDVSKLLGVSERTYKRWEADKSAPHANRMPTIAGTLNVHMRWLMSGDGDVSEPNGLWSSSDPNRELLEEVRLVKEVLIGAVNRLAELECRLRMNASETTRDAIDPDL